MAETSAEKEQKPVDALKQFDVVPTRVTVMNRAARRAMRFKGVPLPVYDDFELVERKA